MFLLSLTLEARLGLAETPPGPPRAEAIPAAKVSVPVQKQKTEKLILVRDGELFQMYRPLNKEEVKAAAVVEAAWQAELDGEKVRLIALLTE